jgi:hypothetical protein
MGEIMKQSHTYLPLLIFILLSSIITTTITFAQTPLTVTVQTDKTPYILRENVNISGTVKYNNQPVEEGLVAIQVDDPVKKLFIRTIPVGSTTQQWAVEVLSVMPCDDAGNLKLTFKKGTYASFMATVRNNAPFEKTVLITISVFDAALTSLGIGAVQLTIGSGQTATIMPSIYIDYWVTPGNAPIYAGAYTAWPKDQGVPYSPEKSANFTIIESEYEPSPNNPLPEQQIQNGTYSTIFQLSPEPQPGTYRISVSAYYKGLKAYAITGFDVLDVQAPPRAIFYAKPPVSGPNISITFDASSSTAEGYGDTITNYQWDFGDGKNATGKIVTHSYQNLGNYTVTLNVTDSEGFWNTTSKNVTILIIHDIAVLDVMCLQRIYDEWIVSVTVTVKNKGTVSETFTVTLYANTSLIETKQVSNLGPLLTQTLTFTWNTTGLTLLANYTLQASAIILENETDTTDNTKIFGPILVTMLGDIMFNQKIDLYDATYVLGIYGVKKGDPQWDIMADFRRDDAINLYDAVVLLGRYGVKYP